MVEENADALAGAGVVDAPPQSKKKGKKKVKNTTQVAETSTPVAAQVAQQTTEPAAPTAPVYVQSLPPQQRD